MCRQDIIEEKTRIWEKAEKIGNTLNTITSSTRSIDSLVEFLYACSGDLEQIAGELIMAGLLGHHREDDIEVDFSDKRLWQKLMVKADHPILKRVDKIIKPYQLERLILELIDAGYEYINFEAYKKENCGRK